MSLLTDDTLADLADDLEMQIADILDGEDEAAASAALLAVVQATRCCMGDPARDMFDVMLSEILATGSAPLLEGDWQ